MNVLDLFSGVGMCSYGLSKVLDTDGNPFFKTVAFCEIEPWPRRVLAKHWPDVPIFEDVRELDYERLKAAGIEDVRCITGGFPCQDLSVAGKQAGIHGERSGLFDEILRIACDIRTHTGHLPILLLENVAALLTGADGQWSRYVFGRLHEVGFDAEWHVIPAGNPDGLSAGAPHRRERVWIVANAQGKREFSRRRSGNGLRRGGIQATENQKRQGEKTQHIRHNTDDISAGEADVADSGASGLQRRARKSSTGAQGQPNGHPAQRREDVAYTLSERGCSGNPGGKDAANARELRGSARQDPGGMETGTTEPGLGLLAHGIAARLARSRWLPEPPIGRVATGVPDRVHKLKALGNGLIWQIPYAIGCALRDRYEH